MPMLIIGATESDSFLGPPLSAPEPLIVFFASTFSRKLQVIFGECCISKLEKVASGARRPWQPVLQT